MMIITVQLAGCFHMGSACDGQLDAVGRVPVLNASAGMQCIRLGWRVTLYLGSYLYKPGHGLPRAELTCRYLDAAFRYPLPLCPTEQHDELAHIIQRTWPSLLLHQDGC